jgi:hypothetical protein
MALAPSGSVFVFGQPFLTTRAWIFKVRVLHQSCAHPACRRDQKTFSALPCSFTF